MRVLRKKPSNSKSLGKELYFILSRVEHLQEIKELPEYRHYTRLLYLLKDKQRETGMSVKSSLEKVREFLKKDLRFNEALYKEQKEAKLQSLMMVAISWLFLVVYATSLEMLSSFREVFICALYQLLGLLIVQKMIKTLKKRTFLSLELALGKLILLLALTHSGLSLNHTLKEVQPDNIFIGLKGELLLIKSELKKLLTRWKEEGSTIHEPLERLIDDLYFLYEQRSSRFVAFVKLLNLFFVALFILPVFLYLSIYPLLRSFLESS